MPGGRPSGPAARRASCWLAMGTASTLWLVPAGVFGHASGKAGGVLPQRGMWWWATYYARPATDQEATAQARQRLSVMLDGLAALGVPVEGDLGSCDPLEAVEKLCADRRFDEIIVTTLPQHVSRWLRADLPHQAERRFGLPVTTIITSY